MARPTSLHIARPTSRSRSLVPLVLCVLVMGCQTTRVPEGAQVTIEEPPPVAPWRSVVQADDAEHLIGVDRAWSEALTLARRGGFARRIAAEGELLDPGAAQPRATLPPGSYRCRLIRIGPPSRRQRALNARGPFFCHVGVEGDRLSLTQQTGTERPGGYLWPDSDVRMVFVGALATGREEVPPPYGANGDRDVVGWIERIGSFRYRLVMPFRAEGVTLEVMELIPAVSGA